MNRYLPRPFILKALRDDYDSIHKFHLMKCITKYKYNPVQTYIKCIMYKPRVRKDFGLLVDSLNLAEHCDIAAF